MGDVYIYILKNIKIYLRFLSVSISLSISLSLSFSSLCHFPLFFSFFCSKKPNYPVDLQTLASASSFRKSVIGRIRSKVLPISGKEMVLSSKWSA